MQEHRRVSVRRSFGSTHGGSGTRYGTAACACYNLARHAWARERVTAQRRVPLQFGRTRGGPGLGTIVGAISLLAGVDTRRRPRGAGGLVASSGRGAVDHVALAWSIVQSSPVSSGRGHRGRYAGSWPVLTRGPGPETTLRECSARRARGDRGGSTLPEGFTVTLFAAEPDVVQPIAMTIDHKGRLWVVENYSYPIWLGGPRGKDRILIFEDADGDGRFDRRTVFYDKGTNFTGIELGFGGVWVCATPNLLFIPDRDGDDRPDGPPVVKLDGWNTNAQHNMFNGLKWGPDGWLWGCNGILSNSRRRQAGHARREAGADQLRRLAVSSDPRGLRGGRARHDQPLGARLRRLRRGVHHQLRDPPPLSRRSPARTFSACSARTSRPIATT